MEKLVRDKIPELVQEKGINTYEFSILSEAEYSKKLKEKLLEEVQEYLESEQLEEIADLAEVLSAICRIKGVTEEELFSVMNKKRQEKGAFDKKILLKTKDNEHEEN